MNLQGKTAVITGAASGIGRALSELLYKEGCHLAMVDIDGNGLQHLLKRFTDKKHRVSVHQADLSQKKVCTELPQQVLQMHPSIDILINNAGISAYDKFHRLEEGFFDRVLEINFQAPVRLTRSFLPLLRKRPESLIINMSSIYGIVAPPARSAYVASKFALSGFSQSLRLDLDNSRVQVMTVYPGGVKTKIASSVGRNQGWSEHKSQRLTTQEEKLLRMSPKYVAQRIITGIKKDKHFLVVGKDARLAHYLMRLFPASYWSKLQFIIRKRLS